MATLNLDLNNPIDFPPLPNRLVKQDHSTRNDDVDEEGNSDNQTRIDDLNDILLELIFTRLGQWKHVAACKCVSKRWNTIISNPDFIRDVTYCYYPFTVLFVSKSYEIWLTSLVTEHPYFQRHKLCFDYIPRDTDDFINIVAQHHDLLVLYKCPFKGNKLTYCITNPLKKQFVEIHLRTTTEWPQFEPSTVGFAGAVSGVSTIDLNDLGFRIVRIVYRYGDYRVYRIQIYYSEKGQWKSYMVQNLDFKFKSKNPKSAVTWNNRVHWHELSNQILVIDSFRNDDFVSYKVLNLPSEIHEYSVLGVCRNRLQISQLEENRVAPRIKVWDIEYDYDGDDSVQLSLVVNFALRQHIVETVFSPIESLFSIYKRVKDQVVCCHLNDPEIVYVVYRDTLLSCNVVKRKLRVIITNCDRSWSQKFVLQHPLTAP